MTDDDDQVTDEREHLDKRIARRLLIAGTIAPLSILPFWVGLLASAPVATVIALGSSLVATGYYLSAVRLLRARRALRVPVANVNAKKESGT